MKETDSLAEELPVACSLTATERIPRSQEIAAFFSGVQEIRELADGYALRFPGDSDWPQRALDFIQGERSCCLFFTFELAFLPAQGPLWLSLRGPEGTSAMVKDMLTRFALPRFNSIAGEATDAEGA